MAFHARVRRAGHQLFLILPAVFVLVLIGFLSWVFYSRSTGFAEREIKNRIQSLAIAAATSFDARDIGQIHTADDMRSPVYLRMVSRLQTLKRADADIAYAYILRRDPVSEEITFVVDANSLDTPDLLDKNKNGMVDEDEQPSLPGQEYDASGMPDLVQGFLRPSVDRAVTHDAWGSFISGYAPILDGKGKPVALVGLDIRADTFIADSRSIFSPIALAVVLALGGFASFFVLFSQMQQRYATLRQVEESKSRFLTASSHQLRTPLTTIRWTFDALPENGSLTNEQKSMIRDAQDAGKRMSDTIDTMLHIASIETGKQNVSASAVFILTELRGLQDSAKAQYQRKNLTVTVECPEHTRSITDVQILREILLELLNNAIWYTPDGGTIVLLGESTPTGVRITVVDSGMGIPETERQYVFAKFFRGEKALLMHPAGNGLGLYLARSLASILGGSLTCSSQEGKGSTFVLTLPDAYL